MKKDLRGIFAVWKPKGPSSYDVIRALKRMTTEKKIGHAGTLDPRASGILVIAVGRDATKRLSEEVAKEKEYKASLRLGMTSTTDDAEGVKTRTIPEKRARLLEIRKLLPRFIGTVSQVPPVYSAIKVKGKEAYKRTRAGEAVVLSARPVEIRDIRIESFRWPYLALIVTTGPGVYIRSLARDIGNALGTGAYLSGLERTRIGDFSKKNAIGIPSVKSSIRKRE
jgi:tRNA pseudouridine55 synthase